MFNKSGCAKPKDNPDIPLCLTLIGSCKSPSANLEYKDVLEI